METAREVGQKIREARKARGMTQAQLADAVGLGQNTLSLIDLGRTRKDSERKSPPSAGLVFAIAVALHVEPTSLYDHPVVRRLCRLAWPSFPWSEPQEPNPTE